MSVLRHGCSGTTYYVSSSSPTRADDSVNTVSSRPTGADENRPFVRHSPPCLRREAVSPLVIFEVVLLVLCAICAVLSWQMRRNEEKELATGEYVVMSTHGGVTSKLGNVCVCAG